MPHLTFQIQSQEQVLVDPIPYDAGRVPAARVAVEVPERGTASGAVGTALLEVVGLSKRYGGLAAVDDLSFRVATGEAFGIAGPNGAGKTTLFDTISGHAGANTGRIVFRGQEIQETVTPRDLPPRHRADVPDPRGVPRAHRAGQHPRGCILRASVARRAGDEVRRGPVERATDAAAFVGLQNKLGAVAGPLSLFDKKRLMMASAIATDPGLLMLDEPVGGLNRG